MVLKKTTRTSTPKASLIKSAPLIKSNLSHIIFAVVMLVLTKISFGATNSESALRQDSMSVDSTDVVRRTYQNLNENYSGDDFIYERSVEKSGWWIRFKRWLSDIFKNLFEINSDAQANDLVDLAMNAFYVLLIVCVVFFIVRAIMNREGSWVFGKSSHKKILSATDVEANIQDTDFSKLIEEAELQNNHRTAIRYYYLWSLKNLSNKGLIDYDVEKTNSDYVLELTSEALKKEFSYASYLYNYIWYGEFDIDATQYVRAKKAFVQLMATKGS